MRNPTDIKSLLFQDRYFCYANDKILLRYIDKLTIIFTLLFLLTSCGGYNKKNNSFEVQIKETKRIKTFERQDKNAIYYSIKIDLVNNSDSIIKFWTMSCSWQDGFIVNKKSIRLWNKENGCDSNFPIIEKINARQKHTYDGLLIFTDTINDFYASDIKIGFALIQEKETPIVKDRPWLQDKKYDSLLPIKIKEQDVIWSEPFKVDN